MSITVAILQSNYIPWKGYFDIIAASDVFVIYDEVQYTKNDWRNRNQIKTSQGLQWLTIPVLQKTLSQSIENTQVATASWAKKHWQALQVNYGKSPCYDEVAPFLRKLYTSATSSYLSQINELFLRAICDFLRITTKIVRSNSIVVQGDRNQRLIEYCRTLGATTYLSGPAAKNYLQPEQFTAQGITVRWMDYNGYPEYPQRHPPFTHFVSIVDLLFQTGQNAWQYLKFANKIAR